MMGARVNPEHQSKGVMPNFAKFFLKAIKEKYPDTQYHLMSGPVSAAFLKFNQRNQFDDISKGERFFVSKYLTNISIELK